jgi:hypothetical protein
MLTVIFHFNRVDEAPPASCLSKDCQYWRQMAASSKQQAFVAHGQSNVSIQQIYV